MFILFSILGLIALGTVYEAAGTAYDRRRYPAPGRSIDVGRCRLHLHSQGAGEPTVVLEAGLAATSLSWSYVQPEVAKFTRVCSYDRAGLGWSGTGRAPRTVQAMVAELKLLLHKAGFRGPFILVGHSFGGLLIRAYAAFYPEDVAGLVFVDPVSLAYWGACSECERRRLAVGTKFSRRGAWLARLGIVRFALAALASGGRRFPKLIVRTAAGRATGFAERLVGEIRKLPEQALPMVRSHWSRAQSFETMAATLASLPESARAVLEMAIPPEIPIAVLSASSATEQELRERDGWVQQCQGGQHVRLNDCGHWLQLEQPGMIVSAIREMVERARASSL